MQRKLSPLLSIAERTILYLADEYASRVSTVAAHVSSTAAVSRRTALGLVLEGYFVITTPEWTHPE